MLSGIVSRARDHIKSLGAAGKDVKRDFDDMTRNVTAGLKSIAVSAYALNKIKPGVALAADLQEAMLKVKANLGSGAANARELNEQLSQVRKTAVDISANAPFSATEVVEIENALLKAGLSMKDVMGKGGAAFAATALASLTGEAPAMIGDSMARIGSQFKLQGSGYGDLADWIVRVDDASATSVPELIYGLRMAGSNAKALGISAKDSLTTLGALAPLGERAGSSFNNMLIGMLGMNKQQRELMKAHNLNFFDQGKFIGMEQATDLIRKRFGGIKNDQERLTVLMKIFGEEGGRAANTLISADKGFREIEQSANGAYSIQKKMGVWGEGFNASLKKLAGTAKTTLANIFDPLLAPLTMVSDLLNKIVGKIGDLAGEHPTAAGVVSGGLGLGAIVAGGYGLSRLGRGALAGSRVLKGIGGIGGLIRGIGGTAMGVAEGKAVQAATGVTPVFVTNWPGNLGRGNLGRDATATVAETVAAGGGLKAAGKILPWLKGAGNAAAMGMAGELAAVGAAGVGGFALGKWFEKRYIKGAIGEGIYDLFHPDQRAGVYDLFHPSARTPGEKIDFKNALKNDIKIDIKIDGNGRIVTSSNGMNNHVDTQKRGSFFDMLNWSKAM